jgi:hypothetical protein
MFSDLPNVKIVECCDYEEGRQRIEPGALRLGYFNDEPVNWRTVQWDRKFYEQAGACFDERWTSFRLPAEMTSEKSPETRVLSHEVPERGILIGRSLPPDVLQLTRKNSFWDWLPHILSASELHFVDSSYLNLAESLWAIGLLPNTELHFHAYAKKRVYQSVPPILRGPWKIYENV